MQRCVASDVLPIFINTALNITSGTDSNKSFMEHDLAVCTTGGGLPLADAYRSGAQLSPMV